MVHWMKLNWFHKSLPSGREKEGRKEILTKGHFSHLRLGLSWDWMFTLTDVQTIFSWCKRSFHPTRRSHYIYIVSPYLFHNKKCLQQLIRKWEHIGFLCLLELMFLLFNIYFLISITAGISVVFALCADAWMCNKLQNLPAIRQNIIKLGYQGGTGSKSFAFL